MIIGLDLSSLPYGTGVSRYSANLAQALLSLEPKIDLVGFGCSLRRHGRLTAQIKQLNLIKNPKIYPLPPTLATRALSFTNAPVTWFTGPIDVFHSWDWYTPNPGPAALVSTIHDLALFKFPQFAHPQIHAAHTQSLKRLKRYGAHLIAVSASTKTDLIDLFAFPESAITVIPEALPQERRLTISPEQIKTTLTQYNLTKPYFLFVGTLEPRKNLTRQIEAWRHYRKDYDLVVVGAPGWDKLEPTPGLHYFSDVSDQALAALYSQAILLLYASLYEGFGLPLLEAFYYRLPVVTSRRGGLAEVGDTAVSYADPESVTSIIQAIGHSLTNRDTLVAAGQKRLSLYDWSAIARQTLDVYQKAINRHPGLDPGSI